ncbi:MAG: TonB-dependent receptor, partial [Kiritimatiellaeota bacterium]|nr:TonB-dependent receptor [Kiritimatiellota bacterium]
KDEIFWDGWFPSGGSVNLDKTTRYGTDLGVTWRPVEALRFRLAYQWTHAKFAAGANDGKRIPLVPEHVVTLGGEQTLLGEWSLTETLRGVGEQYMGGDTANAGKRLAGYVTLDLGLRYAPKRCDGLWLLLSCDNILDETTATSAMWGYGDPAYDSYYPANGRTWRLTARYQF